MKFYQQNWFVFLMLVIFFPLGLFLMWKYAAFNKVTKWIITGAIALLVIISFTSRPNYNQTKEDEIVEVINKEQQKENKEEDNKTTKEDDSDNININEETEKIEDVAEKTEEIEVEQPSEMTKDEYKGVIRSYQAQIQLAGEDLQSLSTEMNSTGKTTNKGKDLVYAIYGNLDSADYILKGVKKDIVPPTEYEIDHNDLLQANEHFQNAARYLETFETSENMEDFNNALDEISIGVDNADINIRNVLE